MAFWTMFRVFLATIAAILRISPVKPLEVEMFYLFKLSPECAFSSPQPEAAEDESMKAQVERQATVLVKKEKVATASGQLVGAAFAFIGEMFSSADETEKIVSLTEAFRSKLNECMEKNDDGSLSMTIRMPDDTFVQNMARSLAQMVAGGQ